MTPPNRQAIADPLRFADNEASQRCRLYPELSMNWIVVNLALAIFWLVLGVGILVVEWQRGQSLFGNVIISPGWLCLIVSGYNVIRVMTMYRYLQRQREAEAEEEREREQFLQRPVQVVNPELRFTEEKKED